MQDWINWQHESCPTWWNVYKGDLGVLRSTGAYSSVDSQNRPLIDS